MKISNFKFPISNFKCFWKIIFQRQGGFSLIEIMLAVVLFIILATGAMVGIVQATQVNLLGEQQTIATQYASEGIEAARSIKNQSFSSLVNSNGTGITQSGGVWLFSGSNNVLSSIYTRVLTVSAVQRDGSGNIVASGGTVDTSTKKVTSTVSWNAGPTRSNSVVLSTYLSNWQGGKYTSPALVACFNLNVANSGNEAADGISIATSGNYVYLGRQNNNGYELFVFDITTPASPSLLGKLATGDTANDMAVSGNYVYIASSDNAGELTVVDVSTPTNPTIASKFDLTAGNSGNGNADGLAVTVSGTTLYLARAASAGKELYVFNITTPSSPTLQGSLDLNGDIKTIRKIGNYIYAASSDNTQELQVINVTNPNSPTLAATLDLNEGATQPDALSLAVAPSTNTVFMGRDGSSAREFYVIDVSTPTNPVITSNLDIGTHILQSMDYSDTTKALFFANTAPGSEDYQVIDVSDLSNPALLNNLNLNGTPYKLAYSSAKDVVVIASGYDTCELQIITP